MERMPRKRPPRKKPIAGRVVAGIAGAACAVSAIIAVTRALSDPGGKVSAFSGLVLVLPAILMLRYAFTGVIKVQ
jgi:hypothetical protein